MELLFRDEAILAVRKPSGLPVHPGYDDPKGLPTALQEARRIAGCRVYPVHRLDRATSGILLFALSPENARLLNDAFENRLVGKHYMAVVRGIVPAEGIIDHPIAEAPDRQNGFVRGPEREAVTEFRRLASAELPVPVGRYPAARYSLVAAKPETGRRHQLRRHLKHLSHPIIGDTTYGDGSHNRLFRERFGSARLLLAAVELTFPHPVTGEELTISAAPDANFMAVVEALGWREALPECWLASS